MKQFNYIHILIYFLVSGCSTSAVDESKAYQAQLQAYYNKQDGKKQASVRKRTGDGVVYTYGNDADVLTLDVSGVLLGMPEVKVETALRKYYEKNTVEIFSSDEIPDNLTQKYLSRSKDKLERLIVYRVLDKIGRINVEGVVRLLPSAIEAKSKQYVTYEITTVVSYGRKTFSNLLSKYGDPTAAQPAGGWVWCTTKYGSWCHEQPSRLSAQNFTHRIDNYRSIPLFRVSLLDKSLLKRAQEVVETAPQNNDLNAKPLF